MLSYDISTPVPLFNALCALHTLQQEQHQLARQRPKIVKKIETEDFFQIQIYKQNGNFDSYELKVVRVPGKPQVVNVVVESRIDCFRRIFQFPISDIDVEGIDWQHIWHDNVLVLNVPKKINFGSHDLISTLAACFEKPTTTCGNPANHQWERFFEQDENLINSREPQFESISPSMLGRLIIESLGSGTPSGVEQRGPMTSVRASSQRGDVTRKPEAKTANFAEEQKRDTNERRAQPAMEAERQNHLEREAKKQASIQAERKEVMKEAKRQSRLDLEEAKKTAALEDKRAADETLRQKKQEIEHRRKLEATQQYLSALFGDLKINTGGQSIPSGTPQGLSEQHLAARLADNTDGARSKSQNSSIQPGTRHDNEPDSDVDTQSIDSESNDHVANEKEESLKRHPSLEEVEDEEFVVLRKKFGRET